MRSHSGKAVANRRYRALIGNRIVEGFTDAQGKTQILLGHVDQYTRFELINEIYDDHFILKDPLGEPIANMHYRIKSQSGTEIEGVTDSQGRTSLFAGDKVESIELHYVGTEHEADQGGD